jgi:eukaryotic-like serine/threonine-protein kinase
VLVWVLLSNIQGRKGNVTRFEFTPDKLQQFVRGVSSKNTSLKNIKPAPAYQPSKSFANDLDDGRTQLDDSEVTSTATTSDNYYLKRGLTIDCYKLIERLGSGFSAEVWSASVQRIPLGVDLIKNQKVAIKFYTANALAIPDQVIRVEREYRIAQRIRHPHLIRIYEFLLASPRPNHNFLVMDVAPGTSLATALKETKFELIESLKIIAQIFSGADALHSEGALHRDIKPGNIAFDKAEDGSINCLLLDLGIVSPMFEKSVTAVSRFVGSKHWAPLEQLVGENLDERSDIYSIGAVAYNLLVGVEPFSSSATEAAVAVKMSHTGLTIPDLAGIPTEITEMLNACLSNDPKSRPRSARECLSVLKRHGVEP